MLLPKPGQNQYPVSDLSHISNYSNNWTWWSAIKGVIVQVISDSDKHEVRG